MHTFFDCEPVDVLDSGVGAVQIFLFLHDKAERGRIAVIIVGLIHDAECIGVPTVLSAAHNDDRIRQGFCKGHGDGLCVTAIGA